MSNFRMYKVINFNILVYLLFINIDILNILFFVVILLIFLVIHKLVIWINFFFFNFVRFLCFLWFISLVILCWRSWWGFSWFFFEEWSWNFFENIENSKESILFLFLFWAVLEINFLILFKHTLWSLSVIIILPASILKLTHIS